MCRKTTDVHGSIAGYYYQVLLACRELSALNQLDDCVGIEAGADVRIVKSGKNTSVEAKFHKENMHKYCPDIVKTIFNFYTNSSEDEALIFSTNVSPSRLEYKELLVDNWMKPEFEEAKLEYIKKCLLRYCIEHVTKEQFLSYKAEVNEREKSSTQKDNSYYITRLEYEIFVSETKEYDRYSINKNIDMLEFSNRIKFIFENQDKQDSIKSLRCQILDNIRKNHLGESTLETSIGDSIIDALVYCFFSTITYNSTLTKPKFQDINKVSVKDLRDCIKNYEKVLMDYNRVFGKDNILKAFEEEEIAFLDAINFEYVGSYKDLLIDNYRKIFNGFLNHIKNDDNYERLVDRYSIGTKKSWNSILKVITQAAVLSVFSKCNTEKVKFYKEDSLDNVLIDGVIHYCFKNYDMVSCSSAKGCIRKLMPTIDFSKISDTQIIVLSTNFKSGQRPCDQRSEIKNDEFIYDVTIAKKEEYEKYFKYIQSIDYKCDDCILWNGNDTIIRSRLKKFLSKECDDSK